MALSELYADGFEPMDFIPGAEETKPPKEQIKKPNSAFRGNIVYYTDDNGLIKSVSKKKFSKLPAKYQKQKKKAA